MNLKPAGDEPTDERPDQSRQPAGEHIGRVVNAQVDSADAHDDRQHHGDREDRILDFAKINKYHVGMLPYFLKKLKDTPDGDSNLLDNTLVIYGSPMGDSNIHNHKRCPLFFAGKAAGALKGGLHIKAADGTPMANAMYSALQGIGLNDLASFGDSSSRLDLNTVQEATAAAE